VPQGIELKVHDYIPFLLPVLVEFTLRYYYYERLFRLGIGKKK
jgi:hypothetical protein